MNRAAHRGLGLATLAIAATYIDFLLFAQFAFLDQLQTHLPRAGVEAAMAAMGATGLVGSFATARLLGRVDGGHLLPSAFLAAAGVAALTVRTTSPAALTAAAAAIGGVTALLTVTLAAELLRWVPRARLGLAVGLGTGLAYLACNLPGLFDASATVRSLAAAAVCTVAAAVLFLVPRLATDEPPARADEPTTRGASTVFAALVLCFLLLVWLDSAAFAVVQESAAHLALTWGGERKLVQGIVHAVAALAAGVAIDRGRLRGLLVVTAGLFAIALPTLDALALGAPPKLDLLAALAAPLYAVGISLYSTALVATPSLELGPARRWRAAWLFGVAGWIGSALGVGMAQDLRHVPPLFVALAVSLVIVLWLVVLREPSSRSATGGIIGTSLGLPLACAIAAVAVYGLGLDRVDAAPRSSKPTPTRTAPAEPARAGGATPLTAEDSALPSVSTTDRIAAGRRVYIDEGCIYCHSQYLRPGVTADARWGEPRPLDRTARPPLGGARRQGPDLTRAGARHDAAWQRRHLFDPRSVEPRSSMPSYRHLFAAGDVRGDALVAYLASLGAAHESALGEIANGVQPSADAATRH